MSTAEIVQLLGVAIALIIGIWNMKYNNKRANSQGVLETGQSLLALNQSVELANKRALLAEEKTNVAEARADDLERRIGVLEDRLSYRLVFDVVLGDDPKVEHVQISHYPERRKEPELAFNRRASDKENK